MIADGRKRNKYLKILQKNDLFKHFEDEVLVELLNEFEEEVWPENTCQLDQEKTLYRFHIITSGRLKVYQTDEATGREYTLFILTKNDVFDILCLLEPIEHRVFYETIDEVKILSIPIAKLKEWVLKNPEIHRYMLPYLGKQMRAVEEYASNMTFIDISTRLAKLIVSNINAKSNKLEIINDLPDDEIAKLIGSTRAVVNRHLQEFKTNGILNIGRKKVEIVNLQLLLDKIDKKQD